MKITEKEIKDNYATALGIATLKTYLGRVDTKLLLTFKKNYNSCKYLSNLIKKLAKYNDSKEKNQCLASLCRFYCDIH